MMEKEINLIELTQGKTAIVDADDFARANAFKWYYAARGGNVKHLLGYAVRNERLLNGKRKTMFLHDFVMNAGDGQKVMFINNDSLDCRRENLRFATNAEIQQKKRKQIGTSQKFKGVDFNKKSNAFRARIKVGDETKNLGYYQTAIEAAQAYDAAARQHFGNVSGLNFKDA